MFEQFTERARQAVVLALEETRTLKHTYIGTEHILLGLLREEEGVAAQVLENLDITVERVRARVVELVPPGEEVIPGQIPFTPRAKKVLELALRESKSLGHNYIGTEHILLGVVRENQGVGARVLLDFDANSEIRNEVLRMLTSGSGHAEAGAAHVFGAAVPAPKASPDPKAQESEGLSDDELDKAIDRAIDQLLLEERAFSSRRRTLHDNIDILRAERDRRRRDDD